MLQLVLPKTYITRKKESIPEMTQSAFASIRKMLKLKGKACSQVFMASNTFNFFLLRYTVTFLKTCLYSFQTSYRGEYVKLHIWKCHLHVQSKLCKSVNRDILKTAFQTSGSNVSVQRDLVVLIWT